MNVIVHRGAHEIGGTCIQLSTANTNILLDLGLPLKEGGKIIDIASLKPDAVLISHPHQDHYGFIDALLPEIPVYIGKLGKNLIEATRVMLGKPPHANKFEYFKSWQSFVVGDFTITPYLVDHSAVDAYAFLIEAEGKKIFYSGDFRAHGRKSVLFENIIANPPKDIDLLFMEGTMIERMNDDFPTEAHVEQKIFKTIMNQNNISFIISSSQNIDRIVSAFRACKRAHKTLVVDIYTAWVLEQLKRVSGNVPSMEWNEVMVYATHNHDQRVKANPDFFGDFRRRVYQQRVLPKVLKAKPSGYLFFCKMSHFRTLNSYKVAMPINVIYSQWLGYLKCTNDEYFGAEEVAAYQSDPQVDFVYAHTSGHAAVEDLQTFAAALKPKLLVPVHTEYSYQYKELFDNVAEYSDGAVYEV